MGVKLVRANSWHHAGIMLSGLREAIELGQSATDSGILTSLESPAVLIAVSQYEVPTENQGVTHVGSQNDTRMVASEGSPPSLECLNQGLKLHSK